MHIHNLEGRPASLGCKDLRGIAWMQLVIGVVLEVQLGDVISAYLGPAILRHMVHYRGLWWW